MATAVTPGQEVPAGAEWRLQSAEHQRDRHRSRRRKWAAPPVPDAWLGLAITKAGDRVYVGGGSRAAIYEFTLADGVLTPSRMFPVVADKDRKPEDFIGDVQFSPDGHLLYAADLYRDSVVVVNPQSGLVLSRIKTGRRPYRILFHPSGKSFYVSSWADGSIGQYDANTATCWRDVRVAPHTTDMVWREGESGGSAQVTARLFVSASNTNNVYVLGATESGELSRLETINLALTPRQPLGSTPSGLGLSADGSKLFVACSDANAAAVVDISRRAQPRARLRPTGWYPTARVRPAGRPHGRAEWQRTAVVSESRRAESADGPSAAAGIRSSVYSADADRHGSVRRCCRTSRSGAYTAR